MLVAKPPSGNGAIGVNQSVPVSFAVALRLMGVPVPGPGTVRRRR